MYKIRYKIISFLQVLATNKNIAKTITSFLNIFFLVKDNLKHNSLFSFSFNL